MTDSKIKFSITEKEDKIEIYPLISLEPNTSHAIDECVKAYINPEKFEYFYDFFDTYDSGYFIKEGIRVEIRWSIWTDFIFEIDKPATDVVIEKVYVWVTAIMQDLKEKDIVEKKNNINR